MAAPLDGMNFGNVASILLLFTAVVLLSDPIVGFSELFPDGVFHLLFGLLLLVGGVLLYWSETDTGERETASLERSE